MNLFDSWLVKTKIAHRGLHNDRFPENSIGAFNNAAEHGFAIELDVRTIDDGTVIVFHDDKLSRMTGADSYACNLKSAELDALRLLKTDERIPTFAQTLEAVNGKVPLLIEIKNGGKPGTLEKSVIEILKNYKGEFAVQSFNPYSMEYFRISAPNILRGQLSSMFRRDNMSFVKRFILKRMLLNKNVSQPDFIAYNVEDMPNRFVKKYFGKIPVLAWTVRGNAEYERAKDFSDNIIFESFIPGE